MKVSYEEADVGCVAARDVRDGEKGAAGRQVRHRDAPPRLTRGLTGPEEAGAHLRGHQAHCGSRTDIPEDVLCPNLHGEAKLP